MNPFGTGAKESKLDPRTIKHEELTKAGTPLLSGGIVYSPDDIEHQHKVGICTAIHLTQNRAKVNGRKYSADFQYLLQKKMYDLDWEEGSSIFHALKVGKNVGFLPIELWKHTTEDDRYLSYSGYIEKLQAISDKEIENLKSACIDKIPGYASVDVSDSQAIARAIDESEAGILCRYGCGDTWWVPSWLPRDINPLRRPFVYTSGHAIGMTAFDYRYGLMQKLANTWGTDWNLEGNADINWNTYPMSEAWTILKSTPVIPPYKFTKDLWLGKNDPDCIELQRQLNAHGFKVADSGAGSPGKETSFYGLRTMSAVAKFQRAKGISPASGYFGPKTRAYIAKAW